MEEPATHSIPAGRPNWIPPGPGTPQHTPPFALLTEDIGLTPPTPSGFAPGQGSGGTPGGGNTLGVTVTRALQAALSWKVNVNDPNGFVGALNQSIALSEVEGHVVATWKPRGVAVASDLAGGIAGAQQSIYAMAQTTLAQVLPLIDGLRPLKPDADAEYCDVLRKMATSQITNLVGEMGSLGGPLVARVNQYFRMLLGVEVSVTHKNVTLVMRDRVAADPPPPEGVQNPWARPDYVLGTLGNIRDEFGLYANARGAKRYINSVDDETMVTQFQIALDYVNALLGSWQNNAPFFLGERTPFLGTQLVFISRQLALVSEVVDEVRYVLDSVFIGPSERSALMLTGLQNLKHPGHHLPPITLEGLLSWIQTFVTQEAPAVIQTGGRFGIGEDFARMIEQLALYTFAAYTHAGQQQGSAIATERVRYSLYKLGLQLHELHASARSVGVDHLAS